MGKLQEKLKQSFFDYALKSLWPAIVGGIGLAFYAVYLFLTGPDSLWLERAQGASLAFLFVIVVSWLSKKSDDKRKASADRTLVDNNELKRLRSYEHAYKQNKGLSQLKQLAQSHFSAISGLEPRSCSTWRLRSGATD